MLLWEVLRLFNNPNACTRLLGGNHSHILEKLGSPAAQPDPMFLNSNVYIPLGVNNFRQKEIEALQSVHVIFCKLF
jgi:hypothetical protein